MSSPALQRVGAFFCPFRSFALSLSPPIIFRNLHPPEKFLHPPLEPSVTSCVLLPRTTFQPQWGNHTQRNCGEMTMKSVRVFLAMLTGGTVCASLTGCVTVTNHYPAGVAAQQTAPVYLAAAGQCGCAAHANQAQAGYVAAGQAGCPVCAAAHANPYSPQYYTGTPDPAARQNPYPYYPQQGSATDPYALPTQRETVSETVTETHVVYVPTPTAPAPPAAKPRTNADRARDVIDIAIDVLQEIGENNNNASGSGSGNGGSTSGRTTGGIAGGTGNTSGGIALGGRAGSGGASGGTGGAAGGSSSGNGSASGPGGRAGTSSSSTPPSSTSSGGNTGNLAGRAPASSDKNESAPAAATGSQNGTFSGTTGQAGRVGTSSSSTLPASVGSASGTIGAKKEEKKEEKKEDPQTIRTATDQPAAQSGTVQGTFHQPTVIEASKPTQIPAAQPAQSGTLRPGNQ